jgi:ubiquinone biosynthesis protein COQ4
MTMQTTAPSLQATEDLAALPMIQRWKRAGTALRKVMANPDDTDQVLTFLSLLSAGRSGDTRTGKRFERFLADPAGKKLFDEQRALDSRTVDLEVLASLPPDTLGYAYAMFLRSRGLTPEVFDGAPPGITDPVRSYVIQRLRQTHDLWHVVTGCPTDPAGEVALQAFTFAQLRSPGSGLLALFGGLRSVRNKPQLVRDIVTLYRAGKHARRLPTFAWEDHWATPLAEVRRLLRLPVEPPARAAA